MANNNNKNKKLIYGTLIYAVGTLSSKVLTFLIVPLYTYYILPAELGMFDLLISTVNFLTPLITLQISDAAFVWMVKGKESNSRCVTAVYKYMMCMSALTVVLIAIFNYLWSIPYCGYFLIMLLTSRWMTTIQKLLRGLKKQKVFAVSGIIYTFVYLILNLIQIVVFKLGVVALFQGTIIANVTVILFMIIKEKELRNIDLHHKYWEFQKSLLKFSIPVVPNQLNWWVVNFSDRFVINFFLGSTANGIYSIAYKFPSMLQILFQLFYQSWQDSVLGEKDDDNGVFYSNIFKVYYQLGFSMLLPLIPFTRVFIDLVMKYNYKDASSYISFLYLGTVFQAYSNFMGVGYLKTGKTMQASSTTIYGAIINIAVNVLFIRYIGLHAASISTFVSFVIVFFIRLQQTKDIMKIKVNWIEFFSLFAITIFLSIICIFTSFVFDVILTAFGVIFFLIMNRNYVMLIAKRVRTRIVINSKKSRE